MDLQEVLTRPAEFRYQLLDRMRSDCDYHLGNGRVFGSHLWAGNVPDQIKIMKAIWNSFEEKPEWLTWERIEEYEKKMTEGTYLKKGDWVETPRFLRVQIKEVLFRSDAREQGFTEPTHYWDDPNYDIFGKSIGENRMIFAAVPKFE